MIFGATCEQQFDREYAEDCRKLELCLPHLWFAWHPVKLDDGRWAWLQKVYRHRELQYKPYEVAHRWWNYHTDLEEATKDAKYDLRRMSDHNREVRLWCEKRGLEVRSSTPASPAGTA